MSDKEQTVHIPGFAKHLEEIKKRQSEKENEVAILRASLEARERELDSYRHKMREEQLAREKKWQNELESREMFFSERERNLIDRQRDFEIKLMERQSEIENLRTHLHQEVSTRELKLNQAVSDLEKEKERYNEENRQRIEKTSKNYVSEALDTLDKKETQFHRMSKIWSFIGAGALIVGASFFVYVSVNSANSITAPVTWEFIIFSALKGIISVGLLVGLARYGFLFSNAYMREALKNADRRHAINFGKFYLESYGAAADWTQVKEAFEHWNISSDNAFSKETADQLHTGNLEKAASIIEKASKLLSKSSGKKDA